MGSKIPIIDLSKKSHKEIIEYLLVLKKMVLSKKISVKRKHSSNSKLG